MIEEIQIYLDDTKDKMNNTIHFLENELSKMRAGKATPKMLEGISIDYYGTISPIQQCASITSPDAKTIIIQPWDRSVLGALEKAIIDANIGVTPMSNGEIIRLTIPPLTEERRKQIVKQVKTEGENAKIGIRNIRRDVNEELKSLKKEGIPEDEIKIGEDEVQKMTDAFVKKVDDIITKKEADVMKV
jgi:ribosome recycling factor